VAFAHGFVGDLEAGDLFDEVGAVADDVDAVSDVDVSLVQSHDGGVDPRVVVLDPADVAFVHAHPSGPALKNHSFGAIAPCLRCRQASKGRGRGQERGSAVPGPDASSIAQSALLVIDAQDSFKAGQRWVRRSNPAFERNAGALIDAYRGARLPVVFFLHTDSDEGFNPGSPLFKLMDFILPRPGEPVWTKTTRSCFSSTPLQHYLMRNGVRRIAIAGIQTEQCCETTARAAADLGYEVDFVTEATMTFPIPNPDRPGEELGVEAIRERTEYVLRGRFAQIATVARLAQDLQALRGGAAPDPLLAR
jgi:nicotinamidase-related amidase